MAWYRESAEKDPALWVAASLMVQFAMRPWSAARLRWGDIETRGDGTIILRYIPTKNREPHQQAAKCQLAYGQKPL